MNELIDVKIFELIEGFSAKNTVMFDVFVADAQALAAVFMLLYFGVESYNMMTGDKQIQITGLLRPFAIALIIIFWSNAPGGGFVSLVSKPGEVLTDQAKVMFINRIDEVELLSRQRYALIDSVSMRLMEYSVDVERAESENRGLGKVILSKLGVDLDEISSKLAGMWIYVQAKLKFMMLQVVEFIGITIFQICVFLIFFLQVLFSNILIILGPIAFAFSILPAFKDAYIHWISRFFSISLYSCIAYIVLALAMNLMIYGLEREIDDVLRVALENEKVFTMYVAMSSGGVNFFLVCTLIGALSLLTIPFISTWIISTSGVGHAVGGMVAGGATAAKGAIASGAASSASKALK